MTACELPDAFAELPPTRNHVYHVLERLDDPATREYLIHVRTERTGRL